MFNSRQIPLISRRGEKRPTDLEPADHLLLGDFVRDLLDPWGVGHLPICDSSFRVSHPLQLFTACKKSAVVRSCREKIINGTSCGAQGRRCEQQPWRKQAATVERMRCTQQADVSPPCST